MEADAPPCRKKHETTIEAKCCRELPVLRWGTPCSGHFLLKSILSPPRTSLSRQPVLPDFPPLWSLVSSRDSYSSFCHHPKRIKHTHPIETFAAAVRHPVPCLMRHNDNTKNKHRQSNNIQSLKTQAMAHHIHHRMTTPRQCTRIHKDTHYNRRQTMTFNNGNTKHNHDTCNIQISRRAASGFAQRT